MLKNLKRLSKAIIMLICIYAIVGVGVISFESYLYDYKGSSVVMLTRTLAARSGGTGFAITAPSGKSYTLTNAHICEIGDTLVAHTQNGHVQKVHVVEIYKDHDLCIMTPVEGLRSLDIAKDIQMHERVWLIGHPALRPLTLESGHYAGDMQIKLVSPCPIKQIEKRITEIEKEKTRGIQPNLEELFTLMMGMCVKSMNSQYINNIAYGGNSGSPVVNKWGNVIGVLFAGRRDQPTASSTVPLSAIHDFLWDK